MAFIKSKLFCSAAALCFLVLSCSPDAALSSKKSNFSLVTWNLQTFFDGETSGNEYDEFKGASSSWSRDKYLARLKRLCESITQFDADVLAFEEIENEAIIYDIANCLNGLLSPHKLYGYACFAASRGSSIGCAVLSRFPIESLTVHSVDSRHALSDKAPLMRPLMEVTLSVSRSAPKVKLFVVHWKSKSGGEDIAVRWQKKQESMLAHRINQVLQKTDGIVIACGDFNRDLAEFSLNDDGTVTLSENTAVSEESVTVDSGWLLAPDSEREKGSYFFRNEWEKIDHIFITGMAVFSEFSVLTDGPWVKNSQANTLPYRYTIGTGNGYSDHLPLRCVVSFTQTPPSPIP